MRDIVDSLRRAMGFLTVYPLRASDSWTPETLGSSMAYYPLAGLLIGLALWVLSSSLVRSLPLPLSMSCSWAVSC